METKNVAKGNFSVSVYWLKQIKAAHLR